MDLKEKNQIAVDELSRFFKTVGNDRELARIFLETLGPEGTAYLAVRIKGVSAGSAKVDPSLKAFLGTHEYSEQEKTALEVNSLYNYFKRRHELLSNSIGSVQASEMLEVSKQTIHDRIKEAKLIGLVESNMMRLPLFQFDPEGPNGTVAGLPEVLKELSCSLLGKISWLTTANPVFGGRSPIEAMKRGDLKQVLVEARSVGVA